ncbi:UDP-glycosyltransferase 84A1 [Psilocybe cubensis]|uniref:Glycosyltransferase family 1 protein n=2 Tax=Psilocybe cubensis TaxID=181762 RepID=A0A8H7XLE9_PSICU|nr:UDP-glycosyltransferase 84A1 [Psilocybe cubensis]KAH9476192.1 UDP-glycosyltransferase 84A1 [Psilocybe cubensis]
MQIFAPTSILLEGGQSYGSTGGHIVKVPGLPDMYDWEFFPQEVPLEIDVSVIIKMANEGLEGSDAAFITTGYAAEEVATDALKAWYAKRQQGCYVIGPLVPPKTSNPAEGMTGSAETEEFLNKMLQSHGEKSVVYMSFGTVFWPTKQDYIGEVINAFIEKNMPFIICYASPFASLSEDLIVKINSSGIGLVSKWVPQQYILNHPATGWFVTHGGHNSVMEALGSGIPMICWPFEGDQPAAAAYLSVNLKVAFELLEVRTGEKGLKPLLRSGKQAKGTKEAVAFEIREVIDACRGPEGKALRNNAEKIKDRLKKAWETGGSSRSELQSFCEKFNVDLIFFRQSALRVEASR